MNESDLEEFLEDEIQDRLEEKSEEKAGTGDSSKEEGSAHVSTS